jgi:flagellar hook-associated protein FlgK
MVSISTFYTSLSGMNAQRKVLDVTAHNIANESTPGYHRQRVELRPIGVSSVAAVFAGQNSRVGGVDIVGVNRLVDQLAENRLRAETGAQGGTSSMRASMEAIELAFPEPSENGLGAVLDDFFGGWSDLTSRPGDVATRSQLLERAQTVVDTLRRTSADLTTVSDTAKSAVADLATEVNGLAEQIAELNKAITGSANAANDLSDQRDMLVRRLAELTGADARPQVGGNVDVYIGGRAVVSGNFVFAVDGAGGQLRWAADGNAVVAPPSKAASLMATINDVVPRYQALLDGVAADLVTQVNGLHNAGYDPAGNTGVDFFDPTGITAASISLSAAVDGQPMNIAAGAPVLPGPVAPGPLDGEQARAIAALAGSPTGPGARYQALVSELGVETRAAIRRDTIQGTVLAAAESTAAEVGSVSLDEEMANLVAAQRAYEASARVLTVIDGLLGTLIERTGLAGR